MKLAYNPITAPALGADYVNDDITFDLKGIAIFVKGVRFNGKDTTYSVFKKHTSIGSGGYNGLVPVPSYTTTNVRFLREDGLWVKPDNTSVGVMYTQLTNQNLDDYLSEGKWYYAAGGNTTTNKPTTADAYELYVGRNASGYRYQRLLTTGGIIWFRQYDASKWSSWSRWYTDMNTDQKVLQSATTTSNYRPLVLGYANSTTVSEIGAAVTQQVYTTTSLYVQPSTGSLWASKLFSGGKPVLVEHQSLANYVTLNTAQTITGAKTFNSACLKVSGGANYVHALTTTNTSIDASLRDNMWRIFHSNGSGTDRGISIWSYGTGISNQVLSISAYNIGSTLASPGSATNSLYMHGLIRATSTITGSGFIKSGSSDSYVLLGGGGHKAVSDFMLKSEEVTTNVTTITKSLTVTQAWMDTGIQSTNLPANGTYIVQVSVVANDSTGTMYNCYNSGVMSWYKDGTNDTEADEIILHRSGHAYAKVIYLRTLMQSSGILKLQISSNTNIGKAYNYVFKFKRII